VLGEAETNVPLWLKAWSRGVRKESFKAEGAPDLATSPIPRYDLARLKDYLYVSIPIFSRLSLPLRVLLGHRGFSDAIPRHGKRRPSKSAGNWTPVPSRLPGWVDFVDDNFIGNKKNVKQLLPCWSIGVNGATILFSSRRKCRSTWPEEPELIESDGSGRFPLRVYGNRVGRRESAARGAEAVNTLRPIRQTNSEQHDHGLLVTAGFVLGIRRRVGGLGRFHSCLRQENALPVPWYRC